jgi:hypothetical protein
MARKWRAALVISALTAIAVFAGHGERVSAARKGCMNRGTTVVANRYLRVFYVSRPLDNIRSYYACNLRRNVRRGMTEDIMGDGRRPIVALARSRVAWEDVICDDKAGTCSGTVLRYDTRRRRTAFVADWDRQRPATDLVVTRTGAVAWIRAVGAAGTQVAAVDANGQRVFETSASVEPGSLAVAGRRIYWTSGGEAQTARLD